MLGAQGVLGDRQSLLDELLSSLDLPLCDADGREVAERARDIEVGIPKHLSAGGQRFLVKASRLLVLASYVEQAGDVVLDFSGGESVVGGESFGKRPKLQTFFEPLLPGTHNGQEQRCGVAHRDALIPTCCEA